MVKKIRKIPHVPSEDREKLYLGASKEKYDYDYINPQHYIQSDGRQTWEHMLDRWTVGEVALWCEMTAYKYEDRMGKKPGEDKKREQKKIDWYKNKAKELREFTKNG